MKTHFLLFLTELLFFILQFQSYSTFSQNDISWILIFTFFIFWLKRNSFSCELRTPFFIFTIPEPLDFFPKRHLLKIKIHQIFFYTTLKNPFYNSRAVGLFPKTTSLQIQKNSLSKFFYSSGLQYSPFTPFNKTHIKNYSFLFNIFLQNSC